MREARVYDLENRLEMVHNDILITATEVEEGVYHIITSDNREYLAVQNMYGHYFLYEGNDLEAVINETAARVPYGFGYTIDMCLKSVPTIYIKAWFGDWVVVNDMKAKAFLQTLYVGMLCSIDDRIEALSKHIKYRYRDYSKSGICGAIGYDYREKKFINDNF